MPTRKFMQMKDVLILIVIIAISAAGFFFYVRQPAGSDTHLYAEITHDGTVVKTLPLYQSGVFSLSEKPAVVFEVKDGRAAFIQADCPDKVCIGYGFINTPGKSATCLPNKLILTIRSTDPAPEGAVDAVA